jgi:hypothetical protein
MAVRDHLIVAAQKEWEAMNDDYTKQQAVEAADELRDIRSELESLVARALKAVSVFPDADYEERTWIANFKIALDRDHGYLMTTERTLQDAIDELEGVGDEELQAAQPTPEARGALSRTASILGSRHNVLQ